MAQWLSCRANSTSSLLAILFFSFSAVSAALAQTPPGQTPPAPTNSPANDDPKGLDRIRGYDSSFYSINRARLFAARRDLVNIGLSSTATDEQRAEAVERVRRATEQLDSTIVFGIQLEIRDHPEEFPPALRDAYRRWLAERAALGTLTRETGLSREEEELRGQAINRRLRAAWAPFVREIREYLIAKWETETRVGFAPAFGGGTSLSAFGMLASIVIPQQVYLGLFDPIAGTDRLGLFSTNRRVTMSGGAFAFEQDIGGMESGPQPAPRTYFSYGYFQAITGAASGTGTFDPGAGNRTLLPGPLGGASGFSLGGHPANVVTGIAYRNAYESIGGMVGFGRRFLVDPSVRVSLGGHVGFSRVDTEQNFAGAIPGFARDFAYATTIATDAFTFGARGQVDWMALPNLRTFVKGHAGVALVDGDGRDSLAFTGVATSTAALDADRTQFVGSVSAGFDFLLATAPGTTVTIGGEVGLERLAGFAQVVRDGNNPSQLQLRPADAVYGKAKLGVLF